MSQNDLTIANQGFPAFRADLNDALQALGSLSSGATEPATIYANMLWYDTATNILKMRSEANDAWIDLGTLDQSANTFLPALVSPALTGTPTAPTATLGTDTTQIATTEMVQAAIAAIPASGLGDGQTWQDMSGSRAHSTSYQNTTGRSIFVYIFANAGGTHSELWVSSDNSTWIAVGYVGSTDSADGNFIVPDDWYYRTERSCTITAWAELR